MALADPKVFIEAMLSEMRRVMKLELEQVHERIDQMESAHERQPQNVPNLRRRERVQPREFWVEDEEPYGASFDEEDDRDSVTGGRWHGWKTISAFWRVVGSSLYRSCFTKQGRHGTVTEIAAHCRAHVFPLIEAILHRRLLYPAFLEVFKYSIKDIDRRGESSVDTKRKCRVQFWRNSCVTDFDFMRYLTVTVLPIVKDEYEKLPRCLLIGHSC
ncbi:hypothetical protein F0562_019470 [Nyssa sinensis]|uniref:Uncharacterized protein n=1 Tax=Nyssa sinensis TaxID=561372 RepID=A0A5J5BNE5_9ASTE|nr:hypothetical protein F0562_019470 [Nyssa sinensis]